VDEATQEAFRALDRARYVEAVAGSCIAERDAAHADAVRLIGVIADAAMLLQPVVDGEHGPRCVEAEQVLRFTALEWVAAHDAARAKEGL